LRQRTAGSQKSFRIDDQGHCQLWLAKEGAYDIIPSSLPAGASKLHHTSNGTALDGLGFQQSGSKNPRKKHFSKHLKKQGPDPFPLTFLLASGTLGL